MILESGATVYVGSDLTSEYGSTTALISAGTLTLNDGSILRIDPGYDQPTAIVAAEQLSSSTIKGKIVIGKNSAFGVHFASAEALNDQLAKDGLKNGVALKQNIGAIAYFNTPVTIADNASLYLDASVDNIDVSRAGGDNIHLGSSSAIVVSKAAVEDAKKNSKAVVTIAGSNPSVASAGGKVLLSGAFNTQDKDIKIFAADGVSTLSIDNDIPVESVNGVYTGTIDNDTGTIGSLTVNDNNLNNFTSGGSCPSQDIVEDTITGNLGSHGAGLEFLGSVATGTAGATVTDIDIAARLATFGGAIQGTYTAMQSSIDAVNSRMGMGVSQGNMVFANNAQGAGMWFVPVYRNHDSDSFDADGIEYGTDLDLYGAALGVDYTIASNFRFGAYFNIGSGDADGQGVASKVSNDFDYWGIGAYAGLSYNQFALTADLGYTKLSNDIDGTTAICKTSADPDSTALTVGLTGQVTFETSALDLTPNVGLRYTSLDLDDYSVDSSMGVIALTDAKKFNVVSIPVGLTLSSDLDAGDWTFKPALDLQVTANAGDKELDTNTTFTGADKGYAPCLLKSQMM